MTKLTQLREAKKATIADIAREIGADRTAVYKWEQGLAEPREKFRADYAKALGISVQQLGSLIYAGASK